MSKRRGSRKLSQQVYDRLTVAYKAGIKRSRHDDKAAGIDFRYIYTETTYRTYMQQCKRFTRWIRENYAGCRTLDDCREQVYTYLNSMIDAGMSAWTVATAAAALGKLYGCDYREFNVDLPVRRREDIRRSREATEYDNHISDARREAYGAFCRCCGLRRSEMQALRGGDLIQRNGQYYIHVRSGKGGKERFVPVVGTKLEVDAVVRRFQCNKDVKVFLKIPRTVDVHAFRAEYANRLYKLLERPSEELSREDVYICRGGNLAGVKLDRKALQAVSRALGHNRLDVVVSHYLRA